MLVLVAIGITAALAGSVSDAIATALRSADSFCDRAEAWVMQEPHKT